MNGRLRRLDWIALVVDRRCGARHVVDLVDFYIERKRHVSAYELEVRVVDQLFGVALCAIVKSVNCEYLITCR